MGRLIDPEFGYAHPKGSLGKRHFATAGGSPGCVRRYAAIKLTPSEGRLSGALQQQKNLLRSSETRQTSDTIGLSEVLHPVACPASFR